MFFGIGRRYLAASTSVIRSFTTALIDRVFPNPAVRVKGSRYVDVSLNKNHGKLLVHLVNMAGPHADPNIYVFDDIPPIGPLTIQVACDEKPSAVRLEPAARELSWDYADGFATIQVDRVEIYDIVVIE